MDTRVNIKKNFTVVREVLLNNYQSRNVIGPYKFLENKPKKFDFVHQIVYHWEALSMNGTEVSTDFELSLSQQGA